MASSAPCRVLLVEDDPGDANLLRQALALARDSRYEITWVSSLADARGELQTRSIDVVLLDLSLPDSTGIDTVRAGYEAAGTVPLVVLTGHDDASFALKTLEAGAQDYLVKGCDTDALVRALRHAISRSRLEQALRASEQRLQRVLAGTNEGWWDWDLLADVRYYSPRWWAMLGFTQGAFATDASSRRLLIHPDDATNFDRVYNDALASDVDTYEVEIRLQHRDGHYVPILTRGHIVRDSNGKPIRVSGANMDLTERKLAEGNSRLAVLGTLAAGAAHEINNPLTFITANLGFVSEELDRLRPQLPAEQDCLDEMIEAIQEAQEGADRVRTIVSGLRAFSRPANESRVAVDVMRAIETALHFARNDLRHRATVTTFLHEVPRVLAFPHSLEQVFLNLLVNASLAIPEGHAQDNEISVSLYPGAAGEVIAEVRDTGTGITPEVQTRLFEPFFTTRSVGAGTGLGLSICHGIVTSLGGRIEVESTLGAGSLFRVVLPAATQPATEPAARIDRIDLPAGHRVLVIDDDPHVAKSIARAISGGPEILILLDAREALRRIQAGEHFDLILCDLMMPDLTGMEFQLALHVVNAELAAGIIFITGGAFTPQAREFLAASRNLFIEKPFQPEQLRRAVAARLLP